MSKPPTLAASALPFENVEAEAAPAPITRPTNYARSLFHVACGAGSLAILRLLPERLWLIAASGAFLVTAWSMEAIRRRDPSANERMMRFFSAFAHPHERHRVNSSTWYITALFLLALFAPLRSAELGVLILAVADPAAGFVGRRFGRTRLRANRSLEGALAFLTVGALAGMGWLSIADSVSWPLKAALAGLGALAGCVAELISTRLDDNFTIPIAVSAAAAGAELLAPFLL